MLNRLRKLNSFLCFQVHVGKTWHSKNKECHSFTFIFSKFNFLLTHEQQKSENVYTVWCLGVESDLLLTNDAVEHHSQCLEVFQNEDMLLTTFLWGQRVQLIFLHLVPNTKYIHIWKHTHKCTDTVYIQYVVNRNIYDRFGDVWICYT